MSVKVSKRKGKPGWWLIIRANGRRKMKSFGDDKASADRVAKEARRQLATGDLAIREEQARPFEAYWARWLDGYVKLHCAPATYATYETAGRVWLVPHFGPRDIAAIERADVIALAAKMQGAGRSRSTIKGYLAPLAEMFTHAIEDGHVKLNPVRGVMRRTRQDAEASARAAEYLTREELTLLLDTFAEHAPRFYPFVLTLARTGLRLGEAIALEWGDVDFHGGFLMVRRTEGRTTTKSGKMRRVDMSTLLASTLRGVHLAQRKAALAEGLGCSPRFPFAGVNGDNFRAREWRRMLEKAKLRYVTPHALRHTFASLLIQQGESLAYVKEQLGHHSIRITVDTYGHLVPGGNRAAVNKLDERPAQPVEEAHA